MDVVGASQILGVDMTVWSFDVTVSTHGLLKQGVCEARMLSGYNHHRVVIEAESFGDASLLAATLGCNVSVRELANRPLKGSESHEDGDVMCTGVYVRI
jgi:hypothetical protein